MISQPLERLVNLLGDFHLVIELLLVHLIQELFFPPTRTKLVIDPIEDARHG
jgi:hypothetical protein